MKRFQEKIKDLIEAREYEAVRNYAADVEQTISAYRFTDATAELLAKWLDEIARLAHGAGGGAAVALAGNRGAGKSHLLSVLAGVIEQPDLRAHLSNSHVASSAQSLPRRQLTVLRIMRGAGETLTEELDIALTLSFNEPGINFGSDPAQMLATAARRVDTHPLIVIVDSAPTRLSRVKRDDGEQLGAMAEVARQANVFLAAALDDDISGADGVNAAIARTFQIDFLDQEHLYRILDAHIYPKKATARPLLRDLYTSLRGAMPGFNWSEPRFNALYPIHPVVADVTPAVRLYAQNFAFLPFAAESGKKTLNRPVHSLIALDEIFDGAEPDLRKSSELADSFVVYDDLANNTIGQIPVMQRLHAKLALKGLFVLSLDGRGASAREIAAAMLIYDENEPHSAVVKVEQILQTLAAATNKLRVRTDGEEKRYCLSDGASANFETRLAELAAKVQDEQIEKTLRAAGGKRFADWSFTENEKTSAEIFVDWRGSLRRGQIVWHQPQINEEKSDENFDWKIVLSTAAQVFNESPNGDSIPALVWQIAPLKSEEQDILRRFVALQTNSALIEEFGEAAAVAAQTHAALVARIWTRAFLDEASFSGERTTFSVEARAANTFENFLERSLSSIFEQRFPAHPKFTATLSKVEVTRIAGDFYEGSDANAPVVQGLVKEFLAPLNLVVERGAHFVLESDERLLQQPLIKQIWEKAERAGDAVVVPLVDIYELGKAAPYGYSRETQHLILGALAARRKIEFVTNAGERIGNRSLDLQIAWTDIVGVARLRSATHSVSELIKWAQAFTGALDLANLSFDAPKDVAAIRTALGEWLTNWRAEQILKRFEDLPDDNLNVRAWRLATNVGRIYGAAVEALENALDDQITLEDCLERVAHAFHNDLPQVDVVRRELNELQIFVAASAARADIWRFVALAEPTGDNEVEKLRDEIFQILENHHSVFDAEMNDKLNELGNEFKNLFASIYVERHDFIMRSAQRPQLLEKLYATAEWSEFVELGELPIFHSRFRERVAELRRQSEQLKCNFEVRQMLRERPFCGCGFRLARAAELENLPHELKQTVFEARRSYRSALKQLAAMLAAALGRGAQNDAANSDVATASARLSELLQRGADLPVLTALDARALQQAISTMQKTALGVRPPRGIAPVAREELRTKLNQWLDNLPDAPFLVKLTDGEN